MRTVLLPLLALSITACASAPERPEAGLLDGALLSNGWTSAEAPLQEGRIAMSVTCPDRCTLGARLLDGDGRALWISLSGEDFGAVYRQQRAPNGDVTAQELLFSSTAPNPFPSSEPVFIEIGLKNGELTGWANNGRLWGFARQLEADLPAIGAWAVYHRDAQPAVATAFNNVQGVIGHVRFENAQAVTRTPPRAGDGFAPRQISDLFYSETVSVADVNRDGVADIITGGLYYLGPDFETARQIFPINTTDPNTYSTGLVSATDDFNGDGWTDLLMIESGTDAGHPALLYLNPRGENRHWERIVIIEHTASEAIAYGDVIGDGARELVVVANGAVGYAQPSADPHAPWTFTRVSDQRERWNPHGIGIGDINGDGRRDIVHGEGWFRHPESAGAPWVFTPVAFGFGAQLIVEDVNGDGRNDVIGSLDGHGWGLAWHEQTASGGFERHLIMGNPAQTPPTATFEAFSQPHAVFVADVNGDGLSDIVSGKRWWAHRNTYRDPDGQGAPVLYAFVQERPAGGIRFTPRFIGDHVGVGNQIAVADVTGDGAPDIVTSARRGTVIYVNEGAR